MQTLLAGCSKAEPKIFAPPQTCYPGARDGQSLISCRWSLPLPKNPVWWGSMHTISSCRVNRPTHTHTHPHTGPITVHCAAASAQCNNYYVRQLYSAQVAAVYLEIDPRWNKSHSTATFRTSNSCWCLTDSVDFGSVILHEEVCWLFCKTIWPM